LTERFDITPDRWPDVSRVFSAAVGLEKSARHAYLDEACDQDSALRVAVDSMLRAHDEAGSFGEAPAFALSGTVKRLAPDTQLGPFRIETLIGAGGMGEVYRAHDTKLQRAVAIKVLPDSFAHDADRRSRFEDEARVLAALNHPHIGAIYGVEESEDVVALVLELVDGVTLDERLAAGPIAFDDVLRIARQLAEGLEAAHDRGIVHRDFKPGNIKITPDGNVKILDFGLAKAAGLQVGAATPGTPGVSRHATQVGAVIGTAGYMSPEQARGQPVDKRTDIWAFGCVLFRMCAQQPPFAGATVTEALDAVIAHEPDWELLPATAPPYLVRILRRCLTKDPKLRLRDIGEARVAIETGDDTPIPRGPARSLMRLIAFGSIAGSVVLAATLALVLYRTSATGSRPAAPVRFEVFPPLEGFFNIDPAQTFFAVSPDGSQLAFLSATESDPLFTGALNRIWVRKMADVEAKPLHGTDGATLPFWSPDGRSLAFSAGDKLLRIGLEGGAPVPVCDLPPIGSMHGTWGLSDPADPEWPGGVILLGSPTGTAIFAVPAGGGLPREILRPNESKGEARVYWPSFLPDGKRFLYTVSLKNGSGELHVGRLDGSTQTVMAVSSNTQWIEPDIVLFVREGVLMAQRVDLEASKTVGEPVQVADQVEYFFTTGRATFSASYTGTIAYHAGGDVKQLVWVDRSGRESGTIGSPADYDSHTRLSHDGKMLLTARRQPGLGTYDIWRHNLIRRDAEERLTTGRGSELTPVWIEGERAILFAGDSDGTIPHLFRRDPASGVETAILPPGSQQLVMDVLPGGRAVAYVERQGRVLKFFQLPLTPAASPAPLLPPHFNGVGLRVSPDGRALAFMGGTGAHHRDLYVASLPMTGDAVEVAPNISSPPRWSADGRHLYYFINDERSLMTMPVRTSPSLTAGMPQQLFEFKQPASLAEVSRDGRFLLLVSLERASKNPIIVARDAISVGRQ